MMKTIKKIKILFLLILLISGGYLTFVYLKFLKWNSTFPKNITVKGEINHKTNKNHNVFITYEYWEFPLEPCYHTDTINLDISGNFSYTISQTSLIKIQIKKENNQNTYYEYYPTNDNQIISINLD